MLGHVGLQYVTRRGHSEFQFGIMYGSLIRSNCRRFASYPKIAFDRPSKGDVSCEMEGDLCFVLSLHSTTSSIYHHLHHGAPWISYSGLQFDQIGGTVFDTFKPPRSLPSRLLHHFAVPLQCPRFRYYTYRIRLLDHLRHLTLTALPLQPIVDASANVLDVCYQHRVRR